MGKKFSTAKMIYREFWYISDFFYLVFIFISLLHTSGDPLEFILTRFHCNFRFNVPDRISGLACLQELNQERKWNFIMVNKPLATVINTRQCAVQVNVTLDEVNKMRYANQYDFSFCVQYDCVVATSLSLVSSHSL